MDQNEFQENDLKLPKRAPKKTKEIESVTGPSSSDHSKNKRNWWLILLVVFMGLQVLLSVYSSAMSQLHYQQEIMHRNEVIRSVTAYTTNLDALSATMLADYKKDVYNNANVNTTAKQQVLGTEYNFNAIMLLIKQNSRLMEVLAQMK